MINQRVSDIALQTEKIEDLLLEYEDSCERFELEKCKIDMRIKLSHLVETKHAEYTLRKSIVAEGRRSAADVAAAEDMASKTTVKPSVETVSVEKQKAYEDAFLDQMNQYIQYGEIEKPIAGILDTKEEGAAGVEDDININDADLSTLREFLGEDEMNSVIKAQESQNKMKPLAGEESVTQTTNCEDAVVDGSQCDEVSTLESVVPLVAPLVEGSSKEVIEDDDDDDDNEFFDAPSSSSTFDE